MGSLVSEAGSAELKRRDLLFEAGEELQLSGFYTYVQLERRKERRDASRMRVVSMAEDDAADVVVVVVKRQSNLIRI